MQTPRIRKVDGVWLGKPRWTLRGMAKKAKWPDISEEPGDLNPEFVEFVMGYPIGWTEIER